MSANLWRLSMTLQEQIKGSEMAQTKQRVVPMWGKKKVLVKLNKNWADQPQGRHVPDTSQQSMLRSSKRWKLCRVEPGNMACTLNPLWGHHLCLKVKEEESNIWMVTHLCSTLSGHRGVWQALASKTCHLTEGNTFKSRSDSKAAIRKRTLESKANYPLTKGDFIELESMRKPANENSHSVPIGALRK